MVFYLGIAIAIAAILILFDLGASFVRRWLQPFLPNDVVGPEGWLVDTKDRRGIYEW